MIRMGMNRKFVYTGKSHSVMLRGKKLYGYGDNSKSQISFEDCGYYEELYLMCDNVKSACVLDDYTVYVTYDHQVVIQGEGEFAERFGSCDLPTEVYAGAGESFFIETEYESIFVYDKRMLKNTDKVVEKQTKKVKGVKGTYKKKLDLGDGESDLGTLEDRMRIVYPHEFLYSIDPSFEYRDVTIDNYTSNVIAEGEDWIELEFTIDYSITETFVKNPVVYAKCIDPGNTIEDFYESEDWED